MKTPRGLTLIEIMVAMAIAAAMFAAVTMTVGALTGSKAKAAAGELAGIIRSLYDTSLLSARTCRLVFDMPGENDEDGVTKYWAECAEGAATTSSNRDEALEEGTRNARDRKPGEEQETESLVDAQAQERSRVEKAAQFSAFTSPEVEARDLDGVRIEVWTKHQREPATKGLGYLYFFPQGFTERAQIYVHQGGNVWTIVVSPLTGKTRVVPEELEVPRS
jgi:general secretion pathway protein H